MPNNELGHGPHVPPGNSTRLREKTKAIHIDSLSANSGVVKSPSNCVRVNLNESLNFGADAIKGGVCATESRGISQIERVNRVV